MKQQSFETRHQPLWQSFSLRLVALEKRQVRSAHSEGFSADYRRICAHLALAQSRAYTRQLVDHLEHLARRGQRQLYRRRGHWSARIIAFVIADFPRQVRRQWQLVLVASLLLTVSLAGTALWIYLNPEQVYSLLEPAQVTEIQSLYDPMQTRLGRGTEHLASTDLMMFGDCLLNNIGAALQAFASGLTLGFGGVGMMLFNGLTFGAVAGHLTSIGYGPTFWSFVIGHGAFELTGIALAGAAGLGLVWALLAPGQRPRSEALREAAKASGQLIYGVLLLLILAAFVEAYWSSSTAIAAWLKYCAGALLWALVLGYFGFAGRHRHAAD